MYGLYIEGPNGPHVRGVYLVGGAAALAQPLGEEAVDGAPVGLSLWGQPGVLGWGVEQPPAFLWVVGDVVDGGGCLGMTTERALSARRLLGWDCCLWCCVGCRVGANAAMLQVKGGCLGRMAVHIRHKLACMLFQGHDATVLHKRY